jgi:glycosyltransferase involved in cell wall biosynthesis
VRFLGTREDAPAILKAADVGIHASHEEGFSNAILEMMGASLPIIVTDVGGAREALLGGGRETPINGSYQAGILVPRRNPIALARALEQLIDDPDLRTQMCFAARTRVMENFSIRKCVDNYEKIYTSVNNR